MGPEIIIYLSLFISAFVFIGFLAWAFWKISKKILHRLVKTWNSFPAGLKSFYIILFILFSLGFFFYNYHYFNSLINTYILSKAEKSLDLEDLSNIYRNIWLLFFAIFGVNLAIWARIVSQRQLEKSIQINRNDRFAKAAEMLDNIENRISSRGGLYILQDLILESPKSEYIRCVEIISYWILEHKNEKIDNYLLNIVAKISKIRSSHKGLENIIEDYKDENDLRYWPYLDSVDLHDGFLPNANLQGANLYNAKLQKLKFYDANLQGVYLRIADLSDADLRNVNLDSANLTEAKMASAKNLTKEQILSAMWKDDDGKGKPPELPDDLMNDPDIKVWLNNPDDKEA